MLKQEADAKLGTVCLSEGTKCCGGSSLASRSILEYLQRRLVGSIDIREGEGIGNMRIPA